MSTADPQPTPPMELPPKPVDVPPPKPVDDPPPKRAEDPPPKPEDPPPKPGDPPKADAVGKLHEKCGANDSCGAGMQCLKYFGIAGARGPEFKTCEIRCDKKTKCPAGTSCGVIADGPGQVCR